MIKLYKHKRKQVTFLYLPGFFQENIILIKYTIQKRILHRQALSFSRSDNFSQKTINGIPQHNQYQTKGEIMLTSCLVALMQVIATLSLHREVAIELGFRM